MKTLCAVLLVLLFTACGPIPISVQSSKQTSKQESRQDVSQEVAQDVANDLNSRSSQGTASMPVIIICNMNSADNSRCAYPQKDGIIDDAKRRYKEAGQ